MCVGERDLKECRRKLENAKKDFGAISSLINIKGLKHDRGKILHKTLFLSVLMYDSEIMKLKDKQPRVCA